jgi:hypothetical protein
MLNAAYEYNSTGEFGRFKIWKRSETLLQERLHSNTGRRCHCVPAHFLEFGLVGLIPQNLIEPECFFYGGVIANSL